MENPQTLWAACSNVKPLEQWKSSFLQLDKIICVLPSAHCLLSFSRHYWKEPGFVFFTFPTFTFKYLYIHIFILYITVRFLVPEQSQLFQPFCICQMSKSINRQSSWSSIGLALGSPWFLYLGAQTQHCRCVASELSKREESLPLKSQCRPGNCWSSLLQKYITSSHPPCGSLVLPGTSYPSSFPESQTLAGAWRFYFLYAGLGISLY